MQSSAVYIHDLLLAKAFSLQVAAEGEAIPTSSFRCGTLVGLMWSRETKIPLDEV
jgi:hypothetical protein